ncbi:hypothetical protein [Dysgonomonas termitidis]|uniref:Uncharacterized protein n=1 Tax=Dysgonomonas termitidis TaxID=1516126 RepID=A0ABV9KSC7_9BACT
MYYEDLTPPEKITVDINLDGLANGETVYIYRKTKVSCNADLKGKTLLKYEVKLGDKDLNLPGSGILYLDPSDYGGVEELNLTINVELKTGTHSIAEHLGLEKYLGSFKYKIKFIHYADLSLKFENTITQDRNLKVSWKPLDLQQLQVSKYEVYKLNGYEETLLSTITDPKDPFFVDESHVLGKQDYLILTYFENNKIEKLWDYHTVQIEYPSGGLDSEPIGFDKIKVWWKKHMYNCNYALELEDGTIIDCKGNTEAEISKTYNFPIYKDIKLHIYPANYTGNISSTAYSTQLLQSSRVKDIYLSGEIAYDLKHKELYVKDQYVLYAVDITTMKTIPDRYVNTGFDWDWSREYMYYSEYFEKLFYITRDYKINIYDRNMKLQSYINWGGVTLNNLSVLHARKDGKLIFGYTDPDGYWTNVYNLSNNQLMYREGPDILRNYAKRSMSKDGTYLSVSEDNYIQIFSFDNIEMLNVNSISTYPINFEECIFSKVDDEELYIVEKEQFYRMNALTKNKTAYIAGKFMTEDPFTGNVAYIKNDNILVILSPDLNEEIYSIPVSRVWDLRLFDNILTTSKSGVLYYVDLKPYIE